MTMLSSLADLHSRTRDHVFSVVPVGTLLSFEIEDAIDVGDTQAGPLFDQNEDFWLFEIAFEDTKRAGPGVHSPRRARATLSISYMTKKHGNVVAGLKKLEEAAAWFRNQTVTGIRFRDFLPVTPVRIQGFTSHSGVINCDFELTQ